ncbi:endonuclease 1-like isoform X2 [Prosopis cineraria]|uniref:endonuclease 1-like isoform X2 n=1 Tax=Prosopis cineraria TaxID=364024 RepID=UPI00241028DE|nr:endonuclease 1-like isoform X2 [Prosopis cineraria]
MGRFVWGTYPVLGFVLVITVPGALAWSKEGHTMTCRIAQSLLDAGADEAMKNLLPDYVKGDLSALCIWPDQIRILYKYRWTSPLHYINIPDNKCSFVYSRDCHDSNGVQGMCVAGAIMNFTSQLLHYEEGTDDPPHNMTEALLFLSHFVGDIHQPMYVGFAGDEGGNAIALRWFRHKSNLYHVWDKEIIVTALKDYYEDNLELLLKDIARNYTDGIWSDDVPSWSHCEDLYNCVNRWAKESKQIACKWGYKGVESGMTLADKTIQLYDYFNTRMPLVMKRIAQGGIRLAIILNQVSGGTMEGFSAAA